MPLRYYLPERLVMRYGVLGDASRRLGFPRPELLGRRFELPLGELLARTAKPGALLLADMMFDEVLEHL